PQTSSRMWRHWSCVSPELINRMKLECGTLEGLMGFSQLDKKDQRTVIKTWKAGR
ncbi:hypothetical protein BD779DRAFT_1428549, partial [Infundibulicybe gibba]